MYWVCDPKSFPNMTPMKSVSSIDAVGMGEEAWNALAAGSPTNSVFQTYQWVSSWERTFKGEHEPWYVSVSDSSGVVGIAPLMLSRGVLGERIVRFLGDGKADYCDFLLAGDKHKAVEAICQTLFAAQDRWDVVMLNSIPAESPTIGLLQSICRRLGYHVLQRDLYSNPVLIIKEHEAEAENILNKAALRRRLNYFQRTGTLTFKTLTGKDVLPYLDEFFEQHIGRWAGSATPSLFLHERNRAFYRELATTMADKEWLALSIVEFNGQPLAMHYGFDYNGRLLWYKPAFDRAHAKHSPGLVLLRYLIGHAIAHQRHEFDFTIGDEPFKARFSNKERTTVQFQICRDPLSFALAWSRWQLGAIRRKLVGK